MFFILAQHKVLKILLKHYNNETYTTSNTTEAGKSLSVEEIHRKTLYSLDKVSLIISSLLQDNYIEKTRIHGKGETNFYFINNKGRSAIANNTFVWYYKADNIIKIATLIIASLGLLNSIFGWWVKK